MDEHGCLSNDDLTKAIILNKFFSSVFTDEDLSCIPHFEPRAPHAALVQDLEITEDMVKSKLKCLSATSSPGPDQIHPRVLREAAKQVAVPLTILFNKSIESGCLPDDWKQGVVVPIFKKGDRQEAGNYRPVSLTAIPCKILESLIRDCLMNHLEDNQLLSRHQHGFRSRRSCTSQLLKVLDDWSLCFEKGDAVDTLWTRCVFRKIGE